MKFSFFSGILLALGAFVEETVVRLSINLMGTFGVHAPDGTALRPKGRKPAALLAYLSYNIGQEISRDLLAELLWSDRGQKQAYDSLRQALYAVRAAFGAYAESHVGATRHSILLQADAASLDLWREDGSINEQLSDVLLADLDHVSPVFQEWLVATRREVRQQQVNRAERLLGQATAEQEASEVLQMASTVLRLDATNEIAARKAMEIRSTRDEMGHAKRVFDNLRAALQAEDLDVSAQTLALFNEIRKQSDGALGEALPPVVTGVPDVVDVPIVAIAAGPQADGASAIAGDFFDLLVWRMTQMPELRVHIQQDEAQAARHDYVLRVNEAARGETQQLQMRLESRTGETVWTNRTKLGTEAQDEEIEATVDATVTQLLPVLEEHVYRTMKGPPTTAYGNYILARRHYIAANDDTYMEQVLAYLLRAVELDPEFLPAIEKLVMHYNTGIFMSRPGTEHREPRKTAYRYAQQMLFLNSKYPNAHVRMAWCLLWKGNHISAERSLRKAMELKPYDPHVLNVMGTALVYLGYPDEAATYYSMSQDRLVHDMDFQRTDYGELHYLNGEFEEALSWIETPEVRTPYRTYFWRIPTFAQLGQVANARKDIEAMLADLRTRWQGPQAFTPEAAIGWMCAMKPYRREQDRNLLIDGFNKAGIKITTRSFPLIER